MKIEIMLLYLVSLRNSSTALHKLRSKGRMSALVMERSSASLVVSSFSVVVVSSKMPDSDDSMVDPALDTTCSSSVSTPNTACRVLQQIPTPPLPFETSWVVVVVVDGNTRPDGVSSRDWGAAVAGNNCNKLPIC